MEINSIPQFQEVMNTPASQSLPVFDPMRDATPWWSAPSSEWYHALENVAPNIGKIIQDQSRSGETWVETLQKILPIIAATEQQRQILKIQVERARRGEPPLDPAQFGAQVNIGLDPRLRNALIIGGAAIIGLLAWRTFKR